MRERTADDSQAVWQHSFVEHYEAPGVYGTKPVNLRRFRRGHSCRPSGTEVAVACACPANRPKEAPTRADDAAADDQDVDRTTLQRLERALTLLEGAHSA